MTIARILDRIAHGRTDLVFDLLRIPGGLTALESGETTALQWFVYFGDVTALRAAAEAGSRFASVDLGRELGNAAFFGHWKVADFLLERGADCNWAEPETGETCLHSALCKAGRPHYAMVLRLLLESGADPDRATIPGQPSGAFMRDVRTCGEYPLHRAAAYGSEEQIRLLLSAGARLDCRDAHGDTPLSWASRHLRPGGILALLAHGGHRVSEQHIATNISDHGAGWGNAMERNLLGDYLPLSRHRH